MVGYWITMISDVTKTVYHLLADDGWIAGEWNSFFAIGCGRPLSGPSQAGWTDLRI